MPGKVPSRRPRHSFEIRSSPTKPDDREGGFVHIERTADFDLYRMRAGVGMPVMLRDIATGIRLVQRHHIACALSSRRASADQIRRSGGAEAVAEHEVRPAPPWSAIGFDGIEWQSISTAIAELPLALR